MKKNGNKSRTNGWSAIVQLIVGAAFLVLSGCSGCQPDDDEKQIRTLVYQAATRAEAHHIGKLFDLATKSFVANPGSLDRRSTKAMLMVLFRRYGSFQIAHPVYRVEISGNARGADVSIPFLIIKEGQTMPDLKRVIEQPARWLEEVSKSADPFILKAHLVKTDGEWKVTTAHVTGRRSVGL